MDVFQYAVIIIGGILAGIINTLAGNGSTNAAGTTLTMTYSYIQDGVTSSCSFTASK